MCASGHCCAGKSNPEAFFLKNVEEYSLPRYLRKGNDPLCPEYGLMGRRSHAESSPIPWHFRTMLYSGHLVADVMSSAARPSNILKAIESKECELEFITPQNLGPVLGGLVQMFPCKL